MNIKQAVIDRLRSTKRENIETVLDFMEKNGFFTYHCHRHHHYYGGLVDHAWQTYKIACRLNTETRAQNPSAPVLNEDSIAIAALLHDLCDCSGLRDITGHGRRSARILKEIGFNLTQEEFLAVRFHMSLRSKEAHRLYDEAKRSLLRYIVHKADGISAHLHKGYEDSLAT
jgi:HD superfamily phosphodiesterase